jgi:hypothetical protein
MASTTETGHAKNVATFEDLISFCTGYRATYNPSKAASKTASFDHPKHRGNCSTASCKSSKDSIRQCNHCRELAFKPLKSLATKIVNGLAATEASAQTVDDVKSTNNKIQGKRAKAVEKPDAKALAAGAEPVKTASTSQQSYDKLIDHFAQLIATLTAEPKYLPNENELKVATLNTLLTDLRAKNTAVISATTALSNARIARDKALYGETTGILDVAQDVKQYVKSLFGASSPQYKQVSGLKFTRSTAE